MLIRRAPAIAGAEIADRLVYAGRRDFIRAQALGLGAASLGLAHTAETRSATGNFGNRLASPLSTRDDKLMPCKSMTTCGHLHEFGPDKDSQANERRLGEFLKRKTLPFNGHAEQVAGLYAGMDLRKNF